MSLQHIKEPTPQVTSSGEEHGLLKVLANSVPFNNYMRFSESKREEMKKLHKYQTTMKKCLYINKIGKNERRELTFNLWDGDPLLAYKFIPDHEYEIPQGLIDMINKQKKQVRSGLLDRHNRPLTKDVEESGDDLFIPVGF